MKISPPELLLDARADLGEGPAWLASERRLLWVDIREGTLHRFEPSSGADESLRFDGPLGFAVPAKDGSILLGLRDGVARLAPGALSAATAFGHPGSSGAETASGAAASSAAPAAGQAYKAAAEAHLEWLARPESGRPGLRINDGKCDPYGRLLFGSMDRAEIEKNGKLYALEPAGGLRVLLTGLGISNGLAWSPDRGTLYFIDTPTRRVTAYDYDRGSGSIADPRCAVEIPESLGWPDGMCADRQGRLWVALWGGAGIALCDPLRGLVLERIPVPARNVSSCCFGGPDLDELYVTSARKGLGSADLPELPLSGGLFRLRARVEGLPTCAYG